MEGSIKTGRIFNFCIFKIWIFLLACCYGRLYLGGRWQKITFQLLQYSPGLDNILQAQTISSNCFNVHTLSQKFSSSSVREDCAYTGKTCVSRLGGNPGAGISTAPAHFQPPHGSLRGELQVCSKHGIREEIHNETEKHTMNQRKTQ